MHRGSLARVVLSASIATAMLAPALATQQPVPPAALAHWRSLRFGMFVHWGPVSLTGHEIGWSRGAQTAIDEYDKLYQRFDPVKFDADAWVATAKAAGMKYLVLTTKHHDGFCLWPSEQTDYDIAGTPFARDVVGELAAACRRGGIEFGTYYSVPDWHHPDYPKGSPAGSTDKPDPHPDRYAEYLRAQVTELVTNYGPLLTMWFDMPREFGPEYGVPTVDLLRKLQPDLVINNRAYTASGQAGHQQVVGDYDTPEQRVGGFQRDRAWETCMTICRQWSWKPDDKLKSLDECVNVLVQTIGGDGNLLLNVGPMPDGRIEPRQVERLAELGKWVEQNAAGIHATRGGPFMPGRYGSSTCAGAKSFVFVTSWPDDGPLLLPAIEARVLSATTVDGAEIALTQNKDGITIDVPPARRTPAATMVVLKLDRDAFGITPVKVPAVRSGSIAFGRPATASNTFRNRAEYGPDKAFDDDPDTRWATDAGTSEAWLTVDFGAPIDVGRIVIDEPEEYARVQRFELQSGGDSDEDWKTFHRGTTLGPGWSHTFDLPPMRRLRLRILEASEGPTLRAVEVFGPKLH